MSQLGRSLLRERDTNVNRLIEMFEVLGPNMQVNVDQLYDLLYRGSTPTEDERKRHQYVGGFVSRANQKYGAKRIVPGNQKGTYYLVAAG